MFTKSKIRLPSGEILAKRADTCLKLCDGTYSREHIHKQTLQSAYLAFAGLSGVQDHCETRNRNTVVRVGVKYIFLNMSQYSNDRIQ
jgi:hypothetical protein